MIVVNKVSLAHQGAAILRDINLEIPEAGVTALANTNLHLMEAPHALAARGPTGKIDTRRSQLDGLRELGRETADAWLRDHGAKLGRKSTLTALPEAVTA